MINVLTAYSLYYQKVSPFTDQDFGRRLQFCCSLKKQILEDYFFFVILIRCEEMIKLSSFQTNVCSILLENLLK